MPAAQPQFDRSFQARTGSLLVALGAALWSLDSIFRARLIGSYSPFLIVFLSQSVCAVFVLPALAWNWRRLLALSLRDWLAFLYLAVAGNILAMAAFTFAFAHASSYSVPILIQKVQPFVTTTMAVIFLRERLPRAFFPCLAGAVVGSVLLSYRGLDFSSLEPEDLKAVGFALVAAFLWATGTVVGRFTSLRHSHWLVTGLRYGISILLILLALPFWGGIVAAQGARVLADLPNFLGMALVPGLLALSIYYRGLQATRASVACLLELAYPLAAVLVNWLVLGKALTALQLCGALVLVASAAALSLHLARDAEGAPALPVEELPPPVG